MFCSLTTETAICVSMKSYAVNLVSLKHNTRDHRQQEVSEQRCNELSHWERWCTQHEPQLLSMTFIHAGFRFCSHVIILWSVCTRFWLLCAVLLFDKGKIGWKRKDVSVFMELMSHCRQSTQKKSTWIRRWKWKVGCSIHPARSCNFLITGKTCDRTVW